MTGIAFISGFRETTREATGTDALHRDVREHFEDKPGVEVYDLRPWKHDAKGLAALMKRDGITRAIVIGYSWGGGYGSPRLCRELLALGIAVPLVMLCDPVYRPQWLPAWGPANVFGFRALIPGSAVITYPAGVGTIIGRRQEKNVPQGHPIRIGKGKPFKLPLIKRTDIGHTDIDACEEWLELATSMLEEFLDANPVA